jgi:competence protein ComEA
MFKKLLLALVTLMASIGIAFAEVDVNKADQAALDGIKGIGPATSKAIIDARSKGGNFKDWSDFEARVKGVGDKSAAKLSEAGLTVNGQAKAGAAAKVAAPAKISSAAAKTPAVPESKADVTPEAKAKAAEVKPAAVAPVANTKTTTASKPATNK